MFGKMLAILIIAGIAGLGAMLVLPPAVAAQGSSSATRSFAPASVAPGGTVTVTITVANYGSGGGVTETLPAGFTYVSSSLSDSAVTVTGQTVRFTLLGDASFTYTVTAPSVDGSYTFSGTLRDSDRNDHAVGGAATVTVSSGDPLVARYDANGNGAIDRSEVITAINDYLFGEGEQTITRADVIKLINLYLFGPAPAPTGPSAPGAPTGLTATASGQTQIDLSWRAPASDGGAAITGYRIEASTDGSSWSSLVANTGSTATRYSHTGLTAGSARHYRVSAINSAGTGPASTVATATTDSAPDRAALVALYNATGGANWTNNANWLSNRPIGEWHGVTTDVNGRVTWLDLGDNQLAGSIPSELGSLAKLTDLWLNNNQLSGEIPSELGSLANLTQLWLSNNQLTGSIPSELGSLANLTYLGLGSNGLTGEIPAELGSLANLEHLHLGGNQLTGCVPVGLRDVPDNDLASLGLPFCGDAPATSPDRAALVALYNATDGPNWIFNTNWLSDRPLGEWYGVTTDADGRVTRLRLNTINGNEPIGGNGLITTNGLKGRIPPQLGSLSNLEWLSLSGNQLSGPIPSQLGSLSNLEELYLNGNQLSGQIPPQLGSLSNLEWLSLSGNQLSGPIPSQLGSLSNLEELYLNGNQLSGQIPPQLGSLANLRNLSLSGNQLSGQIPSQLGNLANLTWLYLSGNQLSGCIPEGLQDVPTNDLASLGLPFCGDAPATSPDRAALVALYNATGGANWTNNTNWLSNRPIGQWYRVDTDANGRVIGLGLSGNQLTGSIPSQMGSLANLEYLYLGGNQLSGEIPSQMGSLANLRILDLRYNQLTGSIPSQLGNLTNLRVLWLQSNQLSRPIPSELGSLANLTSLDLNRNQLTGSIPSQLGNLAKLEGLNLRSNQLAGSIPPELGNLANLTGLLLDSNQLTGSIPPELGNLANLTGLTLVGNQLSGEIPPQLGNLANLEALYLRRNQLSGEIPSQLGNLANLTSLDLIGNQLSGEIPPQLGSLANLEYLYLSGNQLTGCIPEGLRDVTYNDLASLGLPFCGDTPAVSPDLVVQSPPSVSDSSPSAGASFTLSATVRNRGDGSSDSTTLRYYRSTDSTISTSDTAVGTDPVGGLAASGSSPESISLTAPSTAGTYYYGACVDAVSGESDTGNNCSSAVRVTVTASPDLVVQSPSVSDSSLDTGASFTLSATVRNRGDGSSGSTTLRYYRSTDSSISSSDTAVGTDPVGGLSASGSSPESISLTAPSTAGTYYYGACVGAVSGESDTGNNCSSAVRVTVTVSGTGGNTFGVGDVIPGFPLDAVSGTYAGVSLSGGVWTFHFNGSFLELQDGTRFTCQAAGCEVENRVVTLGTIVKWNV